MIQMNGYPLDAETPLDALTTYLTPNDLFFVRHHWIPQYPSRKGWFLTLDGEVERPMRITLDDLRRMPRTTVTCVLQCAGNGRGLYSPTLPGVQWRYGAVGKKGSEQAAAGRRAVAADGARLSIVGELG